MKGVIIEDEVLACKHLQQILEDSGDINIITTLESVSETIDWFKGNPQPDIVFMDIHLADGLSFEIFNYINITCPIIFTTAYDEYALKAFKVNSVDYLLKPIQAEDIQNALVKLKNISGKNNNEEILQSLIRSFKSNSKYKTHFLVPLKADKLIPLKTSDIACFSIDTGIVKGMTLDGNTFRFEHTLEELAEMLNPQDFFRANRQYIISRKAIKDIDFWFNSRLSVNLHVSVPEKILISKARIGEFKNWFSS